MPEPTPSELQAVEQLRNWKPEAQERALALLKRRQESPWRPFYCRDKTCSGHAHVRPHARRECKAPNGHEWVFADVWACKECGVTGDPIDEWLFEHGRQDQRPPPWRADWLTWFLKGGRGSGKTRSGSEVTNRATKVYPALILIGRTGPDLRETMVEGRSGILATAHPDNKPEWEPSKKKLTWPNGCVGLGFSAEEPDRLRGPESGFFWGDEPAHWPHAPKVWDNVLFGHRVKGAQGLHPKAVLTSTPKSTAWVKERVADPETVTHTVSTYANRMNLDDKFRDRIIRRYEGTRTGRQELHGELLEDVEGALWSWEVIQNIDEHPPLKRIVIGVDPAGSTNKRSDITGIVVVGIDFENYLYVLDDKSGKFSPSQWADRAVAAYEFWQADAIVPEKNYGGDMVRHTLENSRAAKDLAPRILTVDSRRGKEIRAEPVVALYEKKRVFHVGERERYAKMEAEQTEWVPGEGSSPNRIDALVHAITKIAGAAVFSSIASPTDLVVVGGGPSPSPVTAGPSTYTHSRIWTP